jgi:transcriptional regulator with XRE-family HTH domain
VETTYAKRLKRARANAGLSQSELARRIGSKHSGQLIQYLEADENNAQGSKHTARIAQELGVDPVWLATGAGEMAPSAGVREPAARYDVRPPNLAKAIRAMRPELQRALGVLISALSHESGGRTFRLDTNSDAVLRAAKIRRTRSA